MSEGELRRVIASLCYSKVSEFHRYGYQDVTAGQIWTCVSADYKHGRPRLHRLVNDILSLKANRFMNWLMLSVYKGKSPVSSDLFGGSGSTKS
nr:post-transcriptional regulator [Pasteuria penetrans]